MSHEDLQEAVRQRPFVPFRLLISTGGSFDVRHPDQLAVERRSVLLGVTQELNGMPFHRSVRIDHLHIVAIEELPAAGAGTNGTT
jgi:hypothetical protein